LTVVFKPEDVRPVGQQILLKRHPSNADDTLILTPENRIERNLKCTVLASNKGRWCKEKGYVPHTFKIGDTVLVRQWRGIALNPHDESVVFVRDELIEAVVDE
jgi:co-chaperonin GroES (HSP10)